MNARYISGPHSDYYLLMDEPSDHIFAMRLEAHIREGGGMPEIWIDDGSQQVWYVFDGRADDFFNTKGRS